MKTKFSVTNYFLRISSLSNEGHTRASTNLRNLFIFLRVSPSHTTTLWPTHRALVAVPGISHQHLIIINQELRRQS